MYYIITEYGESNKVAPDYQIQNTTLALWRLGKGDIVTQIDEHDTEYYKDISLFYSDLEHQVGTL